MKGKVLIMNTQEMQLLDLFRACSPDRRAAIIYTAQIILDIERSESIPFTDPALFRLLIRLLMLLIRLMYRLPSGRVDCCVLLKRLLMRSLCSISSLQVISMFFTIW